MAKKNLALIAMANANCYVAQVSLGADMEQTIKAFKEAEAFDGPSIIIAYAPCISHGINMSSSSLEMKNAVASGYWTTFRYNPTQDTPKNFCFHKIVSVRLRKQIQHNLIFFLKNVKTMQKRDGKILKNF